MPRKNKTAYNRRKCERSRSQRRRRNSNRRTRNIRGGGWRWRSPQRTFREWREGRAAESAARRDRTNVAYRPATLRSPLRMLEERKMNRVAPTQVAPAHSPPTSRRPAHAAAAADGASRNLNYRTDAAAAVAAPSRTTAHPVAGVAAPSRTTAHPVTPFDKLSKAEQITNLKSLIAFEKIVEADKLKKEADELQKGFDSLPSASTKPAPKGVDRHILTDTQITLLNAIMSDNKESPHIKFAAAALLANKFITPVFNDMVHHIFIGSNRDKDLVQRRQSTGVWDLNYNFTVKHITDDMETNRGNASKSHNTKVAKLITNVNSLADGVIKAKSASALFSIYMTLKRELACATTLRLMTPPYKFDLNQQYALNIAIPSMIVDIETKVRPEALHVALALATSQEFNSIIRENTITQSDNPIFNVFLKYAEFLNRIL